jgi:hypothetical protein
MQTVHYYCIISFIIHLPSILSYSLLKSSIDSLINSMNRHVCFLADIDSTIPALKCELLPECTTNEILFISISPFSGLYKVVSYMGRMKTTLNWIWSSNRSYLLKKRVIHNRLNMHSIVIKAISSMQSIFSSRKMNSNNDRIRTIDVID